ncbi:MAG: alpha/beta hydrolase [Verrucomicrobiales bacterium]
MKTILSALLLLAGLPLTLHAQRSEPLWPKNATPFAKAIDDETGSPLLRSYPTKGSENHNGAAVVICPGGGYGNLAKDHEGHQPAKWFNEQGVSAYVLQYRLGSDGHHYPTQLADVQRAIRWVRAGAANHDLDPNRIAVMGFSAGGHLASMAATLFDREVYEASDAVDEASARPDFAILCYPVISMDTEITHGGSRKNLLGSERANDEALAESVSSEKNVTPRTPPTFLFQTNADTAVPAENATRFFLALRENGVPTEFHCYQDGPHGVGLYRGDPVLGTWSDLLSNWLRSQSFFAPPKPRGAVSGEVTLDGRPVSWGVLSFHPEDENQPVTAVRVRQGKFSVPAKNGPVVGPAVVKFEGSIWEATGHEKDGAVMLDTLTPDSGEPVSAEVREANEVLLLDYRSR